MRLNRYVKISFIFSKRIHEDEIINRNDSLFIFNQHTCTTEN